MAAHLRRHAPAPPRVGRRSRRSTPRPARGAGTVPGRSSVEQRPVARPSRSRGRQCRPIGKPWSPSPRHPPGLPTCADSWRLESSRSSRSPPSALPIGRGAWPTSVVRRRLSSDGSRQPRRRSGRSPRRACSPTTAAPAPGPAADCPSSRTSPIRSVRSTSSGSIPPPQRGCRIRPMSSTPSGCRRSGSAEAAPAPMPRFGSTAATPRRSSPS